MQQALLAIWKQFNLDSKFMFYELHDVEYVTLNNAGHIEYLPKEDGQVYMYFEDEGRSRMVGKHLPNYRLHLLIAANIKSVVCCGKCTHYTKFWKMCVL